MLSDDVHDFFFLELQLVFISGKKPNFVYFLFSF